MIVKNDVLYTCIKLPGTNSMNFYSSAQLLKCVKNKILIIADFLKPLLPIHVIPNSNFASVCFLPVCEYTVVTTPNNYCLYDATIKIFVFLSNKMKM